MTETKYLVVFRNPGALTISDVAIVQAETDEDAIIKYMQHIKATSEAMPHLRAFKIENLCITEDVWSFFA